MTPEFFGDFECEADLWRLFDIEPQDVQIVAASYQGGDYDGDARVVFLQDGKLMLVSGSHCSCYGLEGQWCPEEMSGDALRMVLARSFPEIIPALDRLEGKP